MNISTITYDDLFAHQVQYYTERLAEERAKPESESRIKAVGFLREQLFKIKQAHKIRTDGDYTINTGYYPTLCGYNSY